MSRSKAIAIVGSALLSLALFSLSCGSDKKSNPVTPVPGADVTITITANNGAMSYSPNPATATVGQTVAWRNQAGDTHTATQNGGSGFDTGNISNGATSTKITMGTAGSFGYHCEIHPTMVGTLNVNP